MLDLTQSK